MQGLAIALKCGATKKQFDSTVGPRGLSGGSLGRLRFEFRWVAPLLLWWLSAPNLRFPAQLLLLSAAPSPPPQP